MISLNSRLAGGLGTTYVSGTTEVTGLQCYAVVPREDTTITSITGVDDQGATVDVLALFGLTVSVTLLKDELFVTPMNVTITAIKLLTGTVRVY
jgi:hypothetical protein